jgi:hypothetical protein
MKGAVVRPCALDGWALWVVAASCSWQCRVPCAWNLEMISLDGFGREDPEAGG